ncbi:hypothetical protein D3C72_1610290 [compost metagenome]
MKTALLALSLILGASTVNASTIVASCYGSYEKGRIGDNYTVSLEGNKLFVTNPYVKPVSFYFNDNTVEVDTAAQLRVVNVDRNRFFKDDKKSLTIDFTTGEGKLYVYEALVSAVKAKVVYLSHCTR